MPQAQEIPPNAFAPNNTLDASEPIPGDERVTLDEDDVGAPHLDEGSEGSDDYTDPTPEEKARRAEAAVVIEQEARDGGWISETEWMSSHNGSKKGWKPADQYVEFRRGVLPVVQKENRALRAQVAALAAKDRARETAELERNSRIETAALSAELREAAEAQDWDRHAELIRKVATQAAPPPPAAKPTLSPEVQAEVEEFANSNSWLKTDKVASRAFAREIKLIIDTNTADNLADAMEQAKEEVVRRYPDRFRRAPTRAMGESAGESTRINGGKNHSWANLKPDYRRQAERDIAAGRYSQKDYLAACDDEYFRT
jgi:hypothetical protein